MKMHISKIWKYLAVLTLFVSTTTLDLSAQQKKVNPPAKKPASVQKPAAKPSPTQQKSVSKPSNNTQTAKDRAGNVGDKKGKSDGKADIPGNRTVSDNNVNIDKSRGDVNINVDNSKDVKVRNTKNTSVRRNTYRPAYSRPPYRYGGFSYRCYNPYFYHPYRPFYWGPRWHPWGFFIATLAATAIIVSFADADLPPMLHSSDYFVMNTAMVQEGREYMRSGPSMNYYAPFQMPDVPVLADGEYYYDEGVFYLKGSGGYTVVAAPVGGVVKTIPSGYETVTLDDAGTVKNYYWGGTFYEKVSNGYKVVPPTSGALVANMADGGEEVKMGDVTYVKLGETYYQPVQVNGKDMYEVADVEEDK
jgi:hypothetical protein